MATTKPQMDPIFVVGYMHSGTTLLQSMIGRHPAVFAGRGEGRFFEALPQLRKQFADLLESSTRRRYVAHLCDLVLLGSHRSRRGELHADITDADVETLAASHGTDHAELYCAVFSYLMTRDHKSRWLERTPTHVFHIAEILESVPGARIVEITRDPRDILASKKIRREAVWTSGRYSELQRAAKDLEKAYDPLWDTLSWKSAVRAGRSARANFPRKVMRVAYEDLVSAPEACLREVCVFLDLEFAPAMTDVELKTSAEWRGRSGDHGVYRSSVGRWQATLETRELALCQLIVHDELHDLGYDEVPVAWRDRIRALSLLPSSQRELLVRLARRWKMGGVDYLYNVIRTYGRRLAVLTRN